MIPLEGVDHLSPAKRALYEIRALKTRVAELEGQKNEPIAITGLGLRFPGGASTPESFWQTLEQGTDAITEIADSRWPLDRYYNAEADAPGKMSSRHGAFLEDPAAFDADFFGISPKEASCLDPQHRLALEVAWEALENAGCNPQSLDGSASGVFLALSNGDYGRMVFRQLDQIDAYSSTGNLFSVAAGRISYFLGLNGPCMALDTACSGSLVAIHLACQSLRKGECGLALAGGVNLILSPEIHINFSKSRMMAADGRCKSFDAAADGYVRGEGCGMVVLKRLSDAVASGDRILAVIRGSAVNQDGRSSGLTAPNGTAQQALIREALASARVNPDEIDYVETHGTGTSLGDPIEANALAAALGAGRGGDHPLVLGSVKTNIGHLEAAAGIAGVVKTVLALQHEKIPANLHFKTLNPRIDWHGTPVEVAAVARPWPRGARRRLAGVSSFGFSGTNAHLIIEEPPAPASVSREVERPMHILALSARSSEAVDRLESTFRGELLRNLADIGDLCFTANAGRAQFAHRAVLLGADRGSMAQGPAIRGVKEESPNVVFLFPGQGAQYAGMGRQLYETQPVFRHAIDECADLLKGNLEEPLLEVLWGNARHRLDQTVFTQPALFTIEYALSCLWQSWGVKPAAVLGHSAGEFAAACIAGACTLDEGLKLITERARLMQNALGRGAMTAVAAPMETVREALRGLENKVTLAAFNAPGSVVISGYEAELEIAEQRLASQDVRIRRLSLSHGCHSPQMEEAAAAFAERTREVRWTSPAIHMISSVTGRAVGPFELADPNYWKRELREPVLFEQAMHTLRDYSVFLEVGPGTVLAGQGRQCADREDNLWATSLRQGTGEWVQMLENMAAMYVRGVDIDWAAFDAPYQRRRVQLPTYPFERRDFWLDAAPSAPISQPDEHTEWEVLRESASRQSGQGRLDLRVDLVPERWACLDELSSAYMISALRNLGLFEDAGARISPATLIRQNRIRETYGKLIERWFRKLTTEGFLQPDGADFVAPRPLQQPDTAALLARADALFRGDSIFLDYVNACSEKLPDILSGKESALETLFPGGSFERAEALYEHAPLSAYFASIGRAVVESLVRSRPAGNLSILELGAGTGATSSALLPALPADRSSYFFTDVSDLFLQRAEKKFAAYPFVRYGHRDIEIDDHSGARFDVVVATNVLHAARDIRRAVLNARSLLAPGGILLLCETTDYLPWYDITTALIEGWQRFEDGLRDDHPLLSAGAWTSLLEETGFQRIAAFPEDGSPARVLGQRVFIARAPGQTSPRVSTPAAAAQSDSSGRRRGGEVETIDIAMLTDSTPDERRERLVELVRAHLAAMLRFDSPQRIDRKRRLMDLGLDSLMAIELRTRLTRALALDTPLSATLVFDYPTLDEMADYLERDVLRLSSYTRTDVGIQEDDELEHLNDEEVQELLLKKLQTL